MERRLEGKRRSPCSFFITSRGIAEREGEKEEGEEKRNSVRKREKREVKKGNKEGGKKKRKEEGGEKSFPRRINFLDL